MAPRSRLPGALILTGLALLFGSALEDLAFAGSAPAARSSRVPTAAAAALPSGQEQYVASALDLTPDFSSVVLAGGDMETIPFVTFLVSMFLGVVGYSAWTAFGPASADLRDPFEEHED
eukprot:TRINITY_DN16673_c0_g1_i1.p1 TRINITY_DN16673_c0_g1~~TRINITY_DN16673_c0_g1_i1.p1  ORF type:complete len:139 (+),score=25.88 TRINITY_DN16673_c0_g1_i1:62-418(+)